VNASNVPFKLIISNMHIRHLSKTGFAPYMAERVPFYVIVQCPRRWKINVEESTPESLIRILVIFTLLKELQPRNYFHMDENYITSRSAEATQRVQYL